MPAAAHSAGSSILARRLAESADTEDADIEVAADGANPKVTILPSHTRPRCGQGWVGRTAAQPFRAAKGPCGERVQFFLAYRQAATSNWCG
ncbi:hypothetical protein GCM10018966_050350 [Streptomyces yanii]